LEEPEPDKKAPDGADQESSARREKGEKGDALRKYRGKRGKR
jgi:hypothetical protein